MGETGKRYRPEIDNNGSNQRRRTDKNDNRSGVEVVAYRILCPNTLIGSVIGKSGKVINGIRNDTRAKVKVVDPFPGATDRVITIYSYIHEKAQVDVDDEYNDTAPLCPSQDALLRVHSAIASAVVAARDPEKQNSTREECTIVVPGSQCANIIGKAGSNIKKLRVKTNASIKVTPKDVSDPNHACAMGFDNFVKITGEPEALKKALFAVSAIIYKFAPREKIPLDSNVSEMTPSIIIPADMPIYPGGGFFGSADPMIPPRSGPPLIDARAPEIPLPGYEDSRSMWPVVVPSYGGASRSQELTVQVVCPSDKIGRVIGKGGSTIKSVREASGAHIEIKDARGTKDKGKDCRISIITTESLEDVQSRAVEAVLLLQEKMNEDAEDDVTFQLLVPSKNIGCIIGKGGSIINEIRKRSRAKIRISKGEKPKSANSDEHIEVSGEVKNVRDALIQLVLRLRDDALRDEDGSGNPSGGPEPLYVGDQGFSVPPPLLSAIPPVKPLGYEPRTENGSGIGIGMNTSSDRYKYGSLSMGDDDYGSSYPSKQYGGLLPSSTLEILIPGHAVGKVLGKHGGNMANIRQISGAVIEISEMKSSRGDYVAHISGTPEQKRSAENLIQAFIMAM